MEPEKNFVYWNEKTKASWMIKAISKTNVTLVNLTTNDEYDSTMEKFKQSIKDGAMKPYDDQNRMLKQSNK